MAPKGKRPTQREKRADTRYKVVADDPGSRSGDVYVVVDTLGKARAEARRIKTQYPHLRDVRIHKENRVE